MVVDVSGNFFLLALSRLVMVVVVSEETKESLNSSAYERKIDYVSQLRDDKSFSSLELILGL